jgi:two-component system response regulator AtoC
MPIVVMTAYSTVKDAVQMIKEGAFDYVSKPFEIDELSATIANALRLYEALRDNLRLRKELEGRHRFDSLIGASPPFRRVIEAIGEVCESRANVLLTRRKRHRQGSCWPQRSIHFNSAAHERREPFVADQLRRRFRKACSSASCSATSRARSPVAVASARPGLLPVQADGGTLLLDEIGDMPPALQAKLLRVLQERTVGAAGWARSQSIPVDVRIVAATHQRPGREPVARTASFRADLYYRLERGPARACRRCRERREDVPLLARSLPARSGENVRSADAGFHAGGAAADGSLRMAGQYSRAAELCRARGDRRQERPRRRRRSVAGSASAGRERQRA